MHWVGRAGLREKAKRAGPMFKDRKGLAPI